MEFEIRTKISLARQTHYFQIMATSLLAFVLLAAVIGISDEAPDALLVMLTLAITAYGVLAGNTALDDITNLIADLDEDIAQTTHFGRGIRSRNMSALKMASTGLISLSGLAALTSIFA